MSSAFSNTLPSGQMVWSTLPTQFVSFTALVVTGVGQIPEVGYGRGGSGQGGYDAIQRFIPAVSKPFWTIYPAPSIYSAIFLVDSNGVSWRVTVDTSGHLVTTLGSSGVGVLSYLTLSDLLIALSDFSGQLWNLSVLPSGNLVTIPLRAGLAFFDSIYLKDVNNLVHILTVSTNGNLITT